MKKHLITLLLLSFILTAHAQRKTIDSLKKQITIAKEDTSKVVLLNTLSFAYQNNRADSSLLIAQQAQVLSKKLKFLDGEHKSLNREGVAFVNLGNYTNALTCELSALKIAEQLADQRAIEKYLSNIAAMYGFVHDYKQTIAYIKKAQPITEALHDKQTLNKNLINFGDAYEKLNILDSAQLYTTQAYILASSLKNGDRIGTALNNLGNIYSKKHKSDSALYYYRKAQPFWIKADDDDGTCETTLGMAEIFRRLGQLDSSLYYARRSIDAGRHGGFTLRVLNASQFLTAYFKQQGKIDSAFHYLEVSVAAKDSLFSQEKNKELQNISFAERQRQQELQEKEIAYKTSVRYYLLLGVIVFLVVMAIVLWRNNKQRQKANMLLKDQNVEIEKQKKSLETTLGELKTTQAQLVQSAKMASLGELTAGIAHEIQNPLNFVNNFSEVSAELFDEMDEELNRGAVAEAKAISADIKQNLEKIRHHGKRADFIVKGMLEHSRTSTGERQVTNINVLAEEFLKLSYHGLRAKDKSFNAELVTNFDSGLPKINIVQQDIGRVLINLFGNAFYAVNQKAKTMGNDYKPTVEISTSQRSGFIIITVKDNGIGIPKSIREKIMQPFFTTKPAGEGTGLGLSLSYDIIVKGHGGSIDIKSSEGEGSEFIIKLPVT